jgi:hypothetical protein
MADSWYDGWFKSRANPQNVCKRIAKGELATVFYRGRTYCGVYRNQFTDHFDTRAEAQEALRAIVGPQYHSAPPPPKPKPPKPKPQKPAVGWAQRIILAGNGDIELGYRSLALRAHPDAGGEHDVMVALNLAMEELRARVVH